MSNNNNNMTNNNQEPVACFQLPAGVAIVEDDDAVVATPLAGAPSDLACFPRGGNCCNDDANEFFSFPCSRRQSGEQRERFLIFLRILLKWLEIHDPPKHQVLKKILKEFAALYRQGDKQESIFLLDMYDRVKKTVTKEQWSTGYSYLRMFLAHQRRQRSGRAVASSRAAVVSADGS